MAEPKPLTYDEKKAAEAAFTGASLNPKWTESAQLLYVRLVTAMQARDGELSGQDLASTEKDFTGRSR